MEKIESAAKKIMKAEPTPGSLPPSLAKALEDKAELFNRAGQACYSEILGEVKACIANKLKQHHANLLSSLKDEFGTRGQAEAATHSGPWMEAIVSDLMKAGFEPIVEAIKQIAKGTYNVDAEVKHQEVSLKLLSLAKRTFDIGQKEAAFDLFISAMNKTKADAPIEETPASEETVQADDEAAPTEPQLVMNPFSETGATLNATQIAKAKALANKIAAAGHRDLARKVLAALGQAIAQN